MNVKFIALFILASVGNSAWGNERSLTELVEIGLSKSKEIETKTFEVNALDKQSSNARSWENPIFGFEVGNRDQIGGTAQQKRFSLFQPIGLGRNGLKGEIAEINSQVGKLESLSQRSQLRFRLYSQLFTYAVAYEKAHHAEERVSRFKEVQGFLRSRLFASPQKKAEATIVTGKLQVLSKEFLQLRAQRDVLWEDLKLYLGLSEEPMIKVPWFKNGVTFDFDSLWNKVESQNPEIKARNFSLEKAEKEISLTRREKWTGFGLTGTYTNETGFQPEQTYGVGVTIPIPVFNSGSAMVSAAEMQRKASESRASFENESLKKTLRTTLINYNSAKEVIQALPISTVKQLEESMKVTDQGFRKGQVDLLTYIEADNQHADGIAAVYDAQAEFAHQLSELSVLTAETQIPVEKN